MSDLINRMDAIEKLEYFCMVKALEDQNHPSAEARTQMSSADCISRQDAIDALGEEPEVWMDDDAYSMGMKAQWEYDREAIEALPSAERKGTWIKLDMHRGMEQYKCSACNSECYVPECMGEPLYMFCPICGADMRGEIRC